MRWGVGWFGRFVGLGLRRCRFTLFGWAGGKWLIVTISYNLELGLFFIRCCSAVRVCRRRGSWNLNRDVLCDLQELQGLGELKCSQSVLPQSQVQYSKVVEIKLRVQLAAFLVHGIHLWLLVCLPGARAALMDWICRVRTLARCRRRWVLTGHSRVTVVVKKQLRCFQILAAVESNVGSQMGQKALWLLRCLFAKAFVKLCRVRWKSSSVLISFFEAFLSTFVVFLEQFKQSLVRVE